MRRISIFLALFLAAMPVAADIHHELASVDRIGDLIGMAAGVADDTRIIAMTAREVREKGQDVPVTTADRWHIGSISKSLTTVLLGTLVTEGRLDVDTPLPELLPDLDGMAAGGTLLWHNGSNTMWYALLVILPKKNRVVAVTINQDGKRARDTAWLLSRQLADWSP